MRCRCEESVGCWCSCSCRCRRIAAGDERGLDVTGDSRHDPTTDHVRRASNFLRLTPLHGGPSLGKMGMFSSLFDSPSPPLLPPFE